MVLLTNDVSKMQKEELCMSSIVEKNGARWSVDEGWDDDGVVVVHVCRVHQKSFGNRRSGRCWYFEKVEEFPNMFP